VSSPPPDDELTRAVEHLQAFAREVPREASDTRRRVLASEHPRRSSRGRMAWIAAGLITLFGGPALAHFTGALDLVPEWLAPEESRADRAKPSRAGKPTRAAPETLVIPSPPVEPLTSPAPQATTPAPRPEASGSTRKAKSPKASSEPAVDTRELYRHAHAAHFAGGDPELALRAWDAYLAAAPSDTFAPEARYNRAILLVKLERHTHALDALAPFACAASGAYRQREARALIDRLLARAPQLSKPACLERP
jgi:hypothetical protein